MITVERIELRNVTVHKCFVLELPPTGVVLVTGANGKGKSTIPEAVSVGLFGESLRGKPPWTDAPGQIVIEAFGATIDRRRVNGKNSLQFKIAPDPMSNYDTASKAQEALDGYVGSAELWRRTSAFSSRDSAHFTEASDADRKRLLENVLGLTKLDAASALCRKDMHGYEKQLQELESTVALLTYKIGVHAENLAQDEKEHAALHPPAEGPFDCDDLNNKRDALKDKVHERTEKVTDIATDIGSVQGALNRDKAKCVQINQLDRCPTCGQDVPEEWKEECLKTVAEVETAVKVQLSRFTKQSDLLKSKLSAAQEQLDDVRDKITRAQTANAAHANYLHAQQHLHTRIEKRREELLAIRHDHDETEEELVGLQRKLVTLSVVDKVLSTKGVRAHLLHNALAFIEGTANYWLSRIASKDFKLHLTAYSEKSTGGVKEQIGMEIEGAGGGYGYKAASGGERRRIDVALILALGEIACVAAGVQTRGTLFLDEVFDALDTDGIVAVCDVLADIAQTRCVVVISHNEDVARGLRNVQQHVKL